MEGSMFWIVVLIALAAVAVASYSLGSRATAGRGRIGEADHHWWFGWWVTCDDENCTLQLRMRGTSDNWADAGVVPGGSVKYSESMEYRCNCPGKEEATKT